MLEEIEKNPVLKNLRVAFLIDEAHRSQEGQMGVAIRVPFRKADDPDAEDAEDDGKDEEEKIARIIREHDRNQLFVAFTATPAPATVTLFGAPFDTYSEAEAIAEGYIVDVAASIISYRTLYNLHCPIVPKPDEENLYPKGVVAKALQNVAFQDDGLIQYKAEVMLRIFEDNVKPLIGGRAKAMIVATSRVAGLRYFNIIKEKLKERGSDYKVLYGFSDFVHPETNEADQRARRQRAEGRGADRRSLRGRRLPVDDRREQVPGRVRPASARRHVSRQAGVVDRNAVQTVSRLNRCHEGKRDVVVVDFTNNALGHPEGVCQVPKGHSLRARRPRPGALHQKLHAEILAAGVFTQTDAHDFVGLWRSGTDAQVQFAVNGLRVRFQAKLPSSRRPQDLRLPAGTACKELPLPDVLLLLSRRGERIRAFAELWALSSSSRAAYPS